MPMANGISRLHKIAFQVGGSWFRFAINPENYTHQKPHRVTTIKTKSRIVVEDFQNDIESITIRGTTGFNPTGRRSDRGIEKIKEMKRFLEDYAKRGGHGNTPPDDFYFHNFTNDEFYVVHLTPEGVTYTQDVSSPLTYRYEIKFFVLRKANEPDAADVVVPEIGNRFPSIHDPRVSRPIHPTSDSYSNTFDDLDVYNTKQRTSFDSSVVNPQAPSVASYTYGSQALSGLIGYGVNMLER